MVFSMKRSGDPVHLHLSCEVQTYAWGKIGDESEVARLKSSAEPTQFQVDTKSPYAEVKIMNHSLHSSMCGPAHLYR